jgi:hypothetical protein
MLEDRVGVDEVEPAEVRGRVGGGKVGGDEAHPGRRIGPFRVGLDVDADRLASVLRRQGAADLAAAAADLQHAPGDPVLPDEARCAAPAPLRHRGGVVDRRLRHQRLVTVFLIELGEEREVVFQSRPP